MPESGRGNVDISFEKQVAAQDPGVRQRALALQAFENIAQSSGLELSPALIESVRGLTKAEAKLVHHALVAAREAFGEFALLARNQREIDSREEGVLREDEYTNEVAAPSSAKEQGVSALETVAAGEDVKSSEHPVEERALINRSKKWLRGLIDDDVETLTSADIPRVIESLRELNPLLVGEKADILAAYLNGSSVASIAQEHNVVNGTIYTATSTLHTMLAAARSAQGQGVEPAADIQSISSPLPQPPRPTPPKPDTRLRHPEGALLDTAGIRARRRALREARVQQGTPAQETSAPVESSTLVDATAPEAHAEPSRKEIEQGFVLKKVHKELHVAVERPAVHSIAEWQTLAAQAVYGYGAKHELSNEQLDALWVHSHADDDGEYRKAPEAYQEALAALHPAFRNAMKHGAVHSEEGAKALRTLFNVAVGYKNLDDVHMLLSRQEPAITRNLSQRITMLALVDVLAHEAK